MFVHLPLDDQNLEVTYPGWNTLVKKVTERTLTLKSVMKYVSLTKRQIDYWIQKGVLSSESKEQKWRRFSLLDLFLLAIAKNFKARGIEVAELPIIRERLLDKIGHVKDEVFVPMVYGLNVFLFSDFEFNTGVCQEDPEERKKALGSDYPHKEYIPLEIKLPLSRGSSFFVGLSLKKVCDELVQQIDLADFQVRILHDGQYNFILNGIPLHLESLREEDHPKVVEEKKKLERIENGLIGKEE